MPSPLDRTATASRRRLGCGVALVALAAAGAGHVLYWYAPRERPAAPAPGDLPARLLAAGPLPIRLWIPYPHQNLAALDRAAADPRSTIAALVTLAGVRRARLPRFGPFRVPPSREICVASDARGRRIVAVARVYPGLAALARLAGRMAGNPWLAGGEVEFDGRPARAGWAGRGVWWVATEPEFDPSTLGAGVELPQDPALAVVRLDVSLVLLPQGWYRLERRAGVLQVVTDDGRELRLRLGAGAR